MTNDRKLELTLCGEVWKDIPDYEGIYQASTLGRIKSLEKTLKSRFGFRKMKGKILKVNEKPNGYCYVILQDNLNTKTFRLHKLIALTFIPNPENKPQLNHINGIKTDNSVDNLEWCTAKENTNHSILNKLRNQLVAKSHFSKLAENDVLDIRYLYDKGRKDIKELANIYEVREETIRLIIKRKTWKHI